MIHNDGRQMYVHSFTRIDKIALEAPPNDTDQFLGLPGMIQGLGGRTAPSGAGGMMGPQPQPIVNTRAPECRQEPVTDAGSFTATPPANVREKERQKSIYLIL